MTRSTTLPRRRSAATTFFATVKLARWQIRQTWRLLTVTGLGILAAVVLVCVVPLYSQIAVSAGIRDALRTSPYGRYVTVHSISQQVGSRQIQNVQSQLDQEFHDKLGPYLYSTAQFSIQAQGLYIYPPAQNGVVPLEPTRDTVNLIGAAMPQVSPHIKMLQGRLPQINSPDIEIAILSQTAAALQLKLDSTLLVQAFAGNLSPAKGTLRNVMLHVVGIFQLASDNDAYWHYEDFQIDAPPDGPSIYKALVSNDTLLSVLSQVNTNPTTGDGRIFLNPPDLFWYYQLDLQRIDVNKLDELVGGLSTVLTDISNNPSNGVYVTGTQSYGSLDALVAYRNYISVIRIPATSVLLLLMGLVLYFVSVMTDMLVERKSDAIAVLRSRGASRRQIFATFVAQSVGLGLVALLIGPILAYVVVRIFAQNTLPAADQDALNILTLDPAQVASGLLTYALIAVGVSIIAMMMSIYRVTRSDVLAMRRESARATRRSLWQRMGLDLIAAIIALTGYGLSIYVTNPGVLSTRIRVLVLSPMTLVGSFFLLLGATLLFLRLFPLLLQSGLWVATRGKSAAPLLALAQMSRAPRQSVRTTLLLALATAFAIFALVFSASQARRINDVAAYQVGADFSGKIFGSAIIAKSSTYSSLPGVTSASVGYVSSERAAENGINVSVEVRAMDANTYAQTAAWNEQDSSQPLSSLMSQLIAQRSSVTQTQTIAAIVDTSAWNALHLSSNAHFSISDLNGSVNCLAIAEVQHLPTVVDSTEANDTGDYIPSGGVLVDYASYATIATKFNNTFIPTTNVWLKTRSDSTSLDKARNALVNGPYHLDNLSDRRAIIASLNKDPLYIALLGMLTIGAVTALLLALVGNLIASWQSARSRLTNFAVLRALGSDQRQIASVLLWEQAIVYTTSIVLGMIFGVFLSALALPTLVFTGAGNGSQISNGQFYVIQSVPPIQVVVPLSLWLALGILIIVCMVALGMMVRIVSRPSIGQTLRLNED
ncbi:MAG: hypothetical protein NVSMB33_12260 [Ktedonobacteraceae bacterium]